MHVSTDEVYGSIEEGSWDEEQPLEPNSPYSASKASSDLLARAYHRTHGLPVTITRCSNNYGPYQFPEKVIPLFVTNLIDGADVPLYGEGANVRDWLHVDDHCRGIHLVLERGRPGEVYNIGGGTELSNKELTGLLLEATGAGWDRVRNVTDRQGHDLRYSVDITKISDELGYQPQVPFAEGLAATVEWYRSNRAWWEPLKARAQLVGLNYRRRRTPAPRRSVGSRPRSCTSASVGAARPSERAAARARLPSRAAVGQSIPIAGSSGWMACSRSGAYERGAQVVHDRLLRRAP